MVIKVIKSGAKLLYSVFQITESLRKSLTTVQIVSIVYWAGLSWIFQTEGKENVFLWALDESDCTLNQLGKLE